MNYATPNWIRNLIRQDHKEVQKIVNTKGESFRSYIDKVLPFSLYIDIEQIRKEVINKEAIFIQALAAELNLDPNLIVKELDKAYQKVINTYINNPRIEKITNAELQNKFSNLNIAVQTDQNIREALKKEFGNKIIVSDLSIANERVLIIFPNFDTVSKEFGVNFKKAFNYDAFGKNKDNVRAFLSKNFGKLQNLGHIEIQINPNDPEKEKIKRGLVTPKLLQALLASPVESAQKLTAQFSTQTGQAITKILIKKRFSGSKLVLETLVENAFLIGKIEGQAANAAKANLEAAYKIGANFTQFLKTASTSFFESLRSSKSINDFIADSVLSAMKGKAVKPYNLNTTIEEKTSVKVQTVKIKLPKPPAGTSTLPKLSKTTIAEVSLIELQVLINAKIAQQIKENMGTGDRRDILNLRTGRFAESVKVERLSVSREGMITAFYNYMRNPYGTFSNGGRQEFPRSRDPKLLIAKSIREIAQTKVQNRLRAVLV